MEILPLEQRVAALEEEMGRLQQELVAVREAKVGPWWERIAGTFAEDPIYAAAMRLGREHRESLRPEIAPSDR